MRIFVTGATGFLGSSLLSQLKGHELLCLSRNPKKLKKHSHVIPLLGDLARIDDWKSELKRFAPQWCLHLAWEGLPDYSLSCCRSNLDSSIRLIEVLSDIGVKRVVAAGSCWEYGKAVGLVDEGHLAKDCGVFASTKRSLQMILESVARERGLEYRWGRIFFSYGPGQRDTSLIAQCHAAYSCGIQPKILNPGLVQDFIYIDDVAKGLAAIMKADVASGVFNIGSGVPTTVAHVVNRVGAHFKLPLLFPLQKPELGFWANVSKTTSATGWKAQTSIDDGVAMSLRALDSSSTSNRDAQ